MWSRALGTQDGTGRATIACRFRKLVTLQPKQYPLGPETSGKTPYATISANHPMARDDDWNWIASKCATNRST